VTLVNPPWQFYSPVKLMPLGLSYLGAALREEGRSQVTLLDLNVLISGPKGVLDRATRLVEATKPDVLGLSCTTVQAPFVIEFVRRFKQGNPGVPVLLGGIHASSGAREMLDLCPADVVVHSEGERTLAEVLSVLERDDWTSRLASVSGITYRSGRPSRAGAGTEAPASSSGVAIVTTEARVPIEDLDRLPFPAYDLLPPMARYQPLARKPVFSVMASRGCVHHCAFCSGSRFWHGQRWRSPENVIAEVKWLQSDYDAGFIRFEDDDLLVRRSWADRLLDLTREARVPFSCFARLDTTGPDTVAKLAAAACAEVYHGLESASPRLWGLLRKDMKSGVDLDRCRRLIRLELDAGIIPTVSAIIGIPTETRDEMRGTVDFLAQLRAMGARVQLWILTPYPDTDIVRDWKDHLAEVDRWERFGQFDVFSEAARDAYRGLVSKYRHLVPDFWMFSNEAGVEETGRLLVEARRRLIGAFDFV